MPRVAADRCCRNIVPTIAAAGYFIATGTGTDGATVESPAPAGVVPTPAT